jgi:hypoxanthine-DNA glycosylase
MSAVTNYPINNRDQMIWLLKESKIGLWDMIQSCERENSLDSSIEDEEVNNIELLLSKYPSIDRVAFTGRKSELLFNLNFSHLDVSKVYLPSPSAAFAKMSTEQKIEKYKELLT